MNLLPTFFSKKGFAHKLVERRGDVAVYARSKEDGSQEHFEVIRIKRHNGFVIPGTGEKDATGNIIKGTEQRAQPAEMYPSSEQWGTLGWTYPTKTTAFQKLEALTTASTNVEDY